MQIKRKLPVNTAGDTSCIKFDWTRFETVGEIWEEFVVC